MAPPSALKSPERSQDPEVPLSTPVFALGPGPESSQRGYPAFGAREFRVSGRAPGLLPAACARSRRGQVWVVPWTFLHAPLAPRGRREHRRARRLASPGTHGGAGAREMDEGRGMRRGARCSPVKAPTAFLMSSAWSKSVIDILQLFERAEQVRKD